jgi:hypothetical protein
LCSLLFELSLTSFLGLGTWISPPHEDASGPENFLRDVQDGMSAAAILLQDDDVPMPWEFDFCQYHKHDFTVRCERRIDTTAAAAALVPVVRGRGKRNPCPEAEQHGCGETFATKTNARRHSLSAHHAELVQRHACPDAEQYGCSDTFASKHGAAGHSRVHRGKKQLRLEA